MLPFGMLFKNFGVGWWWRVSFNGYDEIEYMTDCQCACITMTAHLAARLPATGVLPAGWR
jgi:isocitrate dehydrogenase kinase/phosphatase